MTTLIANITTEQETELRTFSTLWSSTTLSSQSLNTLSDALSFGSLAETSLSSSRYELEIRDTAGSVVGKIIYEGSGFFTGSWDGVPSTLTPDMFGIDSVLSAIRLEDALGVELLVYRGDVSGIEVVGSDTQAGSFTLNEFRVGSADAGAFISLQGDLTVTLATSDATRATVSGSIDEFTMYARDGEQAYQFSISGNFSPSGVFTENLDGSFTEVTSNLAGGITGITFQKISYADDTSLTETGRVDLMSATELNLDITALQILAMAMEGERSLNSDYADGTGLSAIEMTWPAGYVGGAVEMLTQADGKTLLVSWTSYYDPLTYETSGTLYSLTRINSDGSLDNSFGTSGSVIYDAGSGYNRFAGIEVDSQGAVFLGISKDNYPANGNTYETIKFGADGTQDLAYGTSGVASASLDSAPSASDMVLLADGTVLLVGGSLELVRFDSSGSSSSFDSGIVAQLLGNSYDASLVVQGDGKVLVGGTVWNGSYNEVAVVRLNTDGTLDTSYGTDGVATYGSDGSSVDLKELVLAPDGGVLLLAAADGGWNQSAQVVRLDTTGQFDEGFYRYGLNSGLWSYPETMQVDADGIINVLYSRDGGSYLARLDENGYYLGESSVYGAGIGWVSDFSLQADGTVLVSGWLDSNNDLAVASLIDSNIALERIFFAGPDTLNINADEGVILNGYSGDDTITTYTGNDSLYGDEGADQLSSGAGNDYLIGGAGDDILTGGEGADYFVAALDGSVDLVTDFSAADDSLVISGVATDDFILNQDARFYAGLSAQDELDRIIYNPATGAVYYDADGTGSTAQVQVATLSTKPVLTGANFILDAGLPILGSDVAATVENDPITIPVGDNDYLPPDWSLAFANITEGLGSVELIDGQLIYTPGGSYDYLKQGESATVSLSYTAVNDFGGFETGALSVTVEGQNDQPILRPFVASDSNIDVLIRPFATLEQADLIEISENRTEVYYWRNSTGQVYSKGLITGNVSEVGVYGTPDADWQPSWFSSGTTLDVSFASATVRQNGSWLEVNINGVWTLVEELSYSNKSGISKPQPFSVSPDNLKVAFIGYHEGNDQSLKVYDFLTNEVSVVDVNIPPEWDVYGATEPLRATEPFFVDNITIVIQAATVAPAEGDGANHGILLVNLNESGLSDQITTENNTFNIIATPPFIDPDNDGLSYSASLAGGDLLPNWLIFDPDTLTLSGTPADDAAASYEIEITATDPFGASASDTFTLNVTPLNDAYSGEVLISGVLENNWGLKASNTLVDPDGMGDVTYTWRSSSDGISWTTLGTGETLELTDSEVGKVIDVTAEYTDAQGFSEIAISAQTQIVSGASKLAYSWHSHQVISGVTIDTDGSAGLMLSANETGNAVSAADALAALKIAVGLNPNSNGFETTPYQYMAADVNQDGRVSASDALAILKMAVKLDSAPSPEWLFANENSDFYDEELQQYLIDREFIDWGLIDGDIQNMASGDNLVAVLKGDVNGSWSGDEAASVLDASYFESLTVGPSEQWWV